MPAAAAAGGGLDHQRVADRARRARGPRRASSTGPPLHGATGTSACSASSLAPILSPRRRITSALGPMNTMPSRSHSSANSGRSATKPQPTHAASARAATQRPLERVEVEVRAARSCRPVVVEAHRLVGLAHEHRRPLGARVQRDRAESAPRSTRSSRTALINRIAASPRLTMAMRRSPRSISVDRTSRRAAARDVPGELDRRAGRRRLGAAARAIVDGEVPPWRNDDVVDDGQGRAPPPLAPGTRLVQAGEPLEHAAAEVRRDARTVVADDERRRRRAVRDSSTVTVAAA